MTMHDIFRARVRLHLEAGKSYNDAIALAHREDIRVTPALGVRHQPQSPAHTSKP